MIDYAMSGNWWKKSIEFMQKCMVRRTSLTYGWLMTYGWLQYKAHTIEPHSGLLSHFFVACKKAFSDHFYVLFSHGVIEWKAFMLSVCFLLSLLEKVRTRLRLYLEKIQHKKWKKLSYAEENCRSQYCMYEMKKTIKN